MRLKPSKWLTAILLLIHIGAILCLLFTPLPTWTTIFIIFSLYYSLCRYALLRSPAAVIKVDHIEKNIWQLTNKKGESWQAKLRGNSFISRYLILLNFNNPVVIWADSVNKSAWRNLRVKLLHEE